MSTLRTSTLRAATGGALLLGAIIVGLFVLPDANRQLLVERKATKAANERLKDQMKQLGERQELVDRLALDQQHLDKLEKNMPPESVGALQWSLSQTLYNLAQQNGVRLQSVKYGLPSRDGAKGTDLESIDVEFTVLGIYPSMKPFMHDLEGSGLPFAVGSARLEESPEGARLGVSLRAFRHAGTRANPNSTAPEET